MSEFNLADMKQLNTEQYERCKMAALDRVASRIGDKPRRANYKRDYDFILNWMDAPLIIIFVGALLVSALHVFDFASTTAGHHYESVDFVTGIRAGHWWYVATQQISYLLMAEFAMLSFFTVWRLQTRSRQDWYKYLNLSFVLAVVAAGFVVVVNVAGSGTLNIPGILPPLLTIGIGIRLEEIMSEALARKTEIENKYVAALQQWEQASADPSKHRDYMPLLRSEIWQYLTVRLQSNKDFAFFFPTSRTSTLGIRA
jgi:hypothetical protein